MKRIAITPMPTETYTRREESLYVRRARRPTIKPAIDAINTIGAVTSHQRSLDENQLGIVKRSAEIPAPTKKKACSPTAHFPALVFGNIFMNLFCANNLVQITRLIFSEPHFLFFYQYQRICEPPQLRSWQMSCQLLPDICRSHIVF